MAGYSKPEQPRVHPLRQNATITANATVRGPLMKHPGSIVGADISSASNHIADDATNNFVINVLANGNVAWTINTAVTDINAGTVTFPTQNSTAANSRFAAGEEITATFTIGSAAGVTFPIGATVWVHTSDVPDYTNE